MRELLVCLMLFFNAAWLHAADHDSLLAQLGSTIRLSARYDEARLDEIARLRQALHDGSPSPATAFERCEQIYEAFKSFNYDSAYHYARRLLELSNMLADNRYRVAAHMKMSFILLSAGLYKETYDELDSLKKALIPDFLKGEYYTLWGRYYYDLAGYANDRYHSGDYDLLGNNYLDSALRFYEPGSFEYAYYSGLKDFKQNNLEEAASFLEELLDGNLDDHQLALTASTLSAIYLRRGEQDVAINLLIRATIADIRSSTKETVAVFHLAELLYKNDDLKYAALCIENAISNAEFYGARQRKLQASSILPLIEGERINGIEAQRNLLIRYAILVTVLVVTLIVLSFVVLRQVKKLKLAQEALTVANQRQQEVNHQLEDTNHRLEELNEKLEEASKIKEEYIGYFFNVDAQFYEKLDKIKNTIELKLREKRYDDIYFFLNKIDARKEKEELLLSFDKIFLRLFPDFVGQLNGLLREEERILLKDDQVLNTDLRIFALMRMGVTDPEKIARILGYSVKTIYSYKSRMKTKALIPGDEFEEKIMELKA